MILLYYSFDNSLFNGVSKSLVSTFSKVAILLSVCKSGWAELEHQRLVVVTLTPSCPANHLPVFFCSTRTIFILLSSFIVILFKFNAKVFTFIVINENLCEILCIGIKNMFFAFICCFLTHKNVTFVIYIQHSDFIPKLQKSEIYHYFPYASSG